MRHSLLALALSCAALSAPALVHAADPIADAAAIVKAANWDAMETITIELDEHSFNPQELRLKAGQPYRFLIKNVGEKDHYYTATEFFKSVAWRKAQTPKPHGGEFKAPYFTAVEAYKNGGAIELYFVTVKKGEFEVVCTIDDHKDQGMHGKIVVE